MGSGTCKGSHDRSHPCFATTPRSADGADLATIAAEAEVEAAEAEAAANAGVAAETSPLLKVHHGGLRREKIGKAWYENEQSQKKRGSDAVRQVKTRNQEKRTQAR